MGLPDADPSSEAARPRQRLWTFLSWGLLILAGLLPISLLSLYSFRVTSHSLRDYARETGESAAQTVAESVARDMEGSIGLAKTFARLPGIADAVDRHDEEAVRERLRVAVESYPHVDRAYVLDTEGTLWSDYPTAPESLGHNFAYRDYFKGLSRKWKPYVSEVFQRQAEPMPMVVAVAAPIRNAKQKLLGGVVYQYRLEEMTQWLRQIRVGRSGYVFLMDHTGNVAVHPRLDLQSRRYTEYAGLAAFQAALQGKSGVVEYEDPLAHEMMMANLIPIPVADCYWVAVAQQPAAEANAPIVRLGWQLGTATGIFAMAALAVVLVLGRIRQQLRLAKDAAEKASHAKSVFLANMSHEIRTPLNAVIGMTELVLDSPLSAQQREFLVTVRDSGESLLSVINDILDLSKIEAGKLALDPVAFDLREGLGDTMKTFAVRADREGLELACRIHPAVPRVLVGDYQRLRQIIVNLIGNAIKFTDRGEVVLAVEWESQRGKDAVLHFTVSDTGIGIPKDKQSIIFEMFEQADSTTTRRYGGTGLGLPIAARLVDLMRGRIWLDSEEGRGSRFHFTVHLGLPDEQPAPARPTGSAFLFGLRVLVVDDNATSRGILEEVLSNWKMSPAAAANAREAIEELREAFRSGNPFSLVLVDAHMPDVDGFVLAEQVRDDRELGSTIIMMLTSADQAEEIDRCKHLRIASYLTKPIKQSELFDSILVALGVNMVEDEAAAAAPADRSRQLPPLRILLAEDSLVNQKLATALLERQGHAVVTVATGRAAVAAMESQRFDLVLMDVQMPEMDGLEATTEIRRKERQTGGHVPIIAMTAHALRGDRGRCLDAGMDEYIAKPIHAGQLFDTIAALLGISERPSEPASIPEDAPPARSRLDWPEILRGLKGDRKLLQLVVATALEETPQLLTRIRDAIAGGNATALRLAAHTLKGSLRYFGEPPAVNLARQLEQMGQANDLGRAVEVFALLETESERLAAALTDYQIQDRAENGP